MEKSFHPEEEQHIARGQLLRTSTNGGSLKRQNSFLLEVTGGEEQQSVLPRQR